MKYLEMNLMKDVPDLYTENYKTFVTEIKEEMNSKTSYA